MDSHEWSNFKNESLLILDVVISESLVIIEWFSFEEKMLPVYRAVFMIQNFILMSFTIPLMTAMTLSYRPADVQDSQFSNLNCHYLMNI